MSTTKKQQIYSALKGGVSTPKNYMKTAEFQMPDIDPKLLPALLAGGAGALTGGALTAMAPEREGEDRSKRRWRILRNALLLGGAGAGGTALLQKGVQNAIQEPLPMSDVSPTQKLLDLASGGWGWGAAAGGAGTMIARTAATEERNAGNAILKAMATRAGLADPSPIHNPEISIQDALTDNFKKPIGEQTAYNAANKRHLELAGINLKRLRNEVHPGLLTGWRGQGEMLKDDAKIWGRRITGAGHRWGKSKRLGSVALAAAIPLLASYLSKPDAPQ